MDKRFTISIDSNDRKSLWDEQRTEEEPLISLNRFGEIYGIDDCCKLLNDLNDNLLSTSKELQYGVKKVQKLAKENEQLKSSDTITDLECEIAKLKKENEQLKTQLQNTSDQRDEFHRGARENANRVGELEKENEQLKQQNDFLTTQLAELSTYMMALGYDIELEFEDGRVIKLNEELKGDVE